MRPLAAFIKRSSKDYSQVAKNPTKEWNMNKKQRENTAKLLYDIVRYSMVGIIFINFAPGKKINFISIALGTFFSFIAYLIAYLLDKKED